MRTLFIVLALLCCSLIHSQAYNLYGGKDHDIYLGCLNCNKTDESSVWNQYGSYGSKYSNTCIWNKYSLYGGEYSDNSPFNQYANYPPVIVDKDGNFYGYFTLNKYHDKRATSNLALTIYKFYDLIPEDVGGWYDKLFNN